MPVKELGPSSNAITSLGLSEDECQSVQQEALRLIALGRAICVGQQTDDRLGVYVLIYFEKGRAHNVGCFRDSFYLLDPDHEVLAVSESFAPILEAVKLLR